MDLFIFNSWARIIIIRNGWIAPNWSKWIINKYIDGGRKTAAHKINYELPRHSVTMVSNICMWRWLEQIIYDLLNICRKKSNKLIVHKFARTFAKGTQRSTRVDANHRINKPQIDSNTHIDIEKFINIIVIADTLHQKPKTLEYNIY